MSFSILYFSNAWVAHSIESCCISSNILTFLITAFWSHMVTKEQGLADCNGLLREGRSSHPCTETVATKAVAHLKAMVFPVIMYGYETWAIKKAEPWRIDAFELWCWRRLLRIPWTARRSNQAILKEISPEYSLEWLMLKLKVQYFGHLMWRTNSFEKTLMLENIEGRRRRGWQRMR